MKISFRNRIICTPTINVLFADPNDIRERTQITKANPFEPPAEHHHITISISQLCVDDLGGGGTPKKEKNVSIFHKHQSECWKQNKSWYRSKVDHEGWCSQRLVTKILTPLWNCWRHKCGNYFCNDESFFHFYFWSFTPSLCTTRNPVTPSLGLPKQMCNKWPEQVNAIRSTSF